MLIELRDLQETNHAYHEDSRLGAAPTVALLQ